MSAPRGALARFAETNQACGATSDRETGTVPPLSTGIDRMRLATTAGSPS